MPRQYYHSIQHIVDKKISMYTPVVYDTIVLARDQEMELYERDKD